jgi:hypothetical protein
MSKIGNNPILQKVSGKLGDTIVFRQGPHGPVMANAPKKRISMHPSQVALRTRFLEAVHYSRRQMTKPEVKALYETAVNKRQNSPYLVALTDYMSVPKIQQIDAESYHGAAGHAIHVYASDDFKVTSVTLVITNAAGQEIERGEATLSEDSRDVWIYTTTAENIPLTGTTVTASVKDIPGNVVSRTLTF